MSEVAMASTNGIMNPHSQHDATNALIHQSTKRKREVESAEPDHPNGKSSVQNDQELPRDVQQQIKDFLKVLESHDPSPSILNRNLLALESSVEPDAKRKKSDQNVDASTIVQRVSSGTYLKLDDFVGDIKAACSAMLDELSLPAEAARTQYVPISPQTSALASQVSVFKKKTEDMLKQENAIACLKASGRPASTQEVAKPLMNGMNASKTITHLTTTPGENKLVLTLYGNAPGAKQLFSSLQESVETVHGRNDVTQPLREAGLPNGISTTQIVPVQSTGLAEDKKPVPTLGELFCPAGSTFQVQPPKSSRHSTTRGSTVGWYQPKDSSPSRSRSSASYFGQNVSKGQWLDYNSTSAEPKRTPKDRSTSFDLSNSTFKDEETDASMLETLFRNAYSSFAPSRDDSAALVPEGLVNRLWWQRVGERGFERLVSNTLNAAEVITPETLNVGVENEIDMEALKQAVDEFKGPLETIDPNLEDTPSIPIYDKDVEEILQEVSALLETLNSYQRNRNLITPPARSTAVPADSSRSQNKPTESEIATYNTLKAQLSLMIAMLPPYAVAKLRSNQLEELNISTKIEVLTDNYKGVMEEDEEAQRAKVAEMASRSRNAQSPSTHRSSTSLYGNQYASSSRPTAPASQYYSQTQTPVRPPSSQQRPPATAPQQYAQRPATGGSYRPQQGYGVPTYPHQVPRPPQTPYAAPSAQYYQTPSAQTYAPSQGYNVVPMTAPQGALGARYPPANTAYQQRPAPTNGLNYQYGNGNNPQRQSSPQKPAQYNSQPMTPQQPRPYGTPTPSVPQDRRFYQPQAMNGTPSTSQPQANQGLQQQQHPVAGNLGATGYHTVMTPAEQATMMERQRAQLAQQQGTQHQVRNATQAGALNGSQGGQMNGNALPAGL